MTTEKKITVVCIGDSITEGFGLEDVTCTYPFLLQEFLEENYRVCALSCFHPNCCKEALALCGDVYVILLGTDAAQNMQGTDSYSSAEEKLAAELQEIITKLRATLPDSLIFLVTPMPASPHLLNEHTKLCLNRLLPCIAAIAADNQLSLIDLYDELSKLPEEELAAIYQDDGIHPNVQGTMLIAGTLAYAIGNRIY